jgi:peptide chain release factor 2
MREAEGLRGELALWGELNERAGDLLAALELIAETPDAELEAELERDAAALETDYRRERTALLFSGEYDDRPALLSISAGAGGTEATDWTEMLLRMYLRWSERHRFPTEILDQQEGEQAGLKSVTVA